MNFDYTEVPNQAILASARKYLQSAEVIESQDAQLELGAILCSSFSIELLLKSLLSTSSPQNVQVLEENSFAYSGVVHDTQYGHSYSKLFENLSLEYREYLSEEFDAYSESGSLVSNLKVFDGSFVKWRYSYEKTGKKINITQLLNLNRFLVETISKMKVSCSECV